MNTFSDGHVLQMRLFRQQHAITLREISAASGMAIQRISRLELLEIPLTTLSKQRLQKAFETILEHRATNAFTALSTFNTQRHSLFDVVADKEKT